MLAEARHHQKYSTYGTPGSDQVPMRLARVGLCFMLALAVAIFISACGDTPVSPESRRIVPAPPPGALQPAVTGLRISGPESMPPGASGQFIATADLADGSSLDVTTTATWTLASWGPQDVLALSSTGLATALRRGEAYVEVVYREKHSGVMAVLVLPGGTFKLSGRVTDEGIGVRGALVEEVSKADPELSTTTDEGGYYALYGVPPDVELRASKSGYETVTQRATLSDHGGIDFELVLSEPRPFWGGRYTLTIVADPSCTSALPQDVRSRSYVANVDQSGPDIEVMLSGADLLVVAGSGNGFSGRVEPDRVVFDLFDAAWSWDYYYEYTGSVVELLNPSVLFSPSGTAIVRSVPSGLFGTLDGLVATYRPTDYSVLASCRSHSHQFILSR